MKRRRRRNSIAIALWVNALVGGAILLVMISRGNFSAPSMLSAARAEQPAIAGGAGVFIVTGQFSPNSFGCYLLDVDHQTIAAYRYTPGDRKLSLEAARNYRFDMQLKGMNTFPLPSEVQRLVEDQENQRHSNPGSDATAPVNPPARRDGTAVPAPGN